MQSVSVFNCKSKFDSNKLKNEESTHVEQVNGHDESLSTFLYVNEEINVTENITYQKCVISMDEVINFKARVFGQNVNRLVIRSSYDIYIDKSSGTLFCLANKKSSEQIQQFCSEKFEVEYDKKVFDLNTIMENANNVKRAQFSKLRIQTLSGGMISGNQVNSTDLYDSLNRVGDLSTISVAYAFNDRDINFSISIYGSIVLFSTLNDDEITDFLYTMNNLSGS